MNEPPPATELSAPPRSAAPKSSRLSHAAQGLATTTSSVTSVVKFFSNHGNSPSAFRRSSRARRSVSSAMATSVSASRARRSASITSMLVAAPARKLMFTMFDDLLRLDGRGPAR